MAEHPNTLPSGAEDNTTLGYVRAWASPLENWHAIAYDEYKNTIFTWRNRQFEITKTYLWLGSALLTFELLFVNEFFGDKRISILNATPDALFYLLEICAVCFASASFFIGIWLLKGRAKDGITLPFSFPDGQKMLDYLGTISSEVLLSENIKYLHKAISDERPLQGAIGKNLRRICLALMMSFAAQASAILWMAARTVYYNHFN